MTKDEFMAKIDKKNMTLEERMDVLEMKLDLVAAGLVKLMIVTDVDGARDAMKDAVSNRNQQN